MDITELKILTGHIITESKLSKQAKIQLLNWIQNEAIEVQLKAFLLDGEIVHLDEQAEQIVNDRFSISEKGGRIEKLRKTWSTQFGSAMGPFWLLYRKIKSAFDNCVKRCGTFELNTARRQHCMYKCKADKAKQELQAAQKTKNPKKVESAKNKLEKALKALKKSEMSFKKRGAEI